MLALGTLRNRRLDVTTVPETHGLSAKQSQSESRVMDMTLGTHVHQNGGACDDMSLSVRFRGDDILGQCQKVLGNWSDRQPILRNPF